MTIGVGWAAASVSVFALTSRGAAPAISPTFYSSPRLTQIIRSLEMSGASRTEGVFMTSNTVLIPYVRGGRVHLFQRTLPGHKPQPPDPHYPVNVRVPGPAIRLSQINTNAPSRLIAAIRRRLADPGFLPDQVGLSSRSHGWIADGRAAGQRVSFFMSEHGGRIQPAPLLN
jgi:hypothetical protein